MARDHDHLARLTSVRTEMEAGIIVGGLEDRGITATMSGVYTANFRTEAPGWVEVLVAEDDLPAAEKALDEVHRDHTDIDWAQVDVGDPEDTNLSESTSRWTNWRRVCYALIVVYLVWLVVQFLAGFLWIPTFGGKSTAIQSGAAPAKIAACRANYS